MKTFNEFKNENITEAVDTFDKKLDQAAGLLDKQYGRKEYKGYKFDYDKMAGTWSWMGRKDGADVQIFATPFWEDEDGIPLSLIIDGEEDDADIRAISWKKSDAEKKDSKSIVKEYLKKMNQTLETEWEI